MPASSWPHKLFHFPLPFWIRKVWKGREKIAFFMNDLLVSSTNICKTRSHMPCKISLENSNLGQWSSSFMGSSILEISLKNSNLGERSISFIAPSIWNKLSNDLKFLNTTTLFTHTHKKLILKKLVWVEHNFNHITIIITKTFIIIIIGNITVNTF